MNLNQKMLLHNIKNIGQMNFNIFLNDNNKKII